MKKRLNWQLMGVSLLGILCTTLILSVVFFGLYREQVLYDLKTDAHILKYAWSSETEERLEADEALEAYRITVIDAEGNVLFDSNADTVGMDNHLDRPEVEDAFATGDGHSIRESHTMGKNTYYYAILLDDGSVLRVATEAGSIWTFLLHAVPLLLLLLCLVFVLCLAASRVLTRRLVAPIESLARDMTNQEAVPVYQEMEPFVATIRKQHEEILRASDMRREFTANVSHELKTPLTAISGYAELLQNNLVPAEDVPHFGEEIRNSAARLLALIDDILRLSQLEQPVQEIHYEAVNLWQVARDIVEEMRISAEREEIQLTVSARTNCEICANRQMIEELVTNLCSNAIRYNYRGGSVFVSVLPGKDAVTLSVQDTGIGIPEEQQERIFERFYRVDKGRSRTVGGTGLGLAIVKHIAAQHGATITVHSEVGKGSEFRVIFPRRIPGQTPETKEEGGDRA